MLSAVFLLNDRRETFLLKSEGHMHNPKLFQELKRLGILNATIRRMHNHASERMQALENHGLYHHEAWEIVKDDVLLPTEEDVPNLGEKIHPYTD